MTTRVTVCIFAVTYCVASISTSTAEVKLKIVSQLSAPAILKNVAIENDSGRQISLIRYRVENQTERTIKGVGVKLVFFDRMHKPIGGETFFEHMKLKRRGQLEFLTPLKNYAASGGTVAIAISMVNTDKETWQSLDPKQVLEEMKQPVTDSAQSIH